MPKVYDSVMFFNELDMLELRFNILDPVVDYFVVCEAEETHSGQRKPLNFIANYDRFYQWRNKIIYLNAGTLSNGQRNSWQRENYHRACIAAGLNNAQSQDIVIVADCDEIPNPDVIGNLADSSIQAAQLELDFHYYNFNHRVREGWAIGAYRAWIQPAPNKIRTCSGHNPHKILNAGWHLSYFLTPEKVIEKVDAFMHHADVAADMPRDTQWIADRMANGLDLFGRTVQIEHVPTSNRLPRYVLDNADKYRAMGWLE